MFCASRNVASPSTGIQRQFNVISIA
jgi:hypothetical protein